MYFIKTYHTGPRIDCGGNKSGGWTFSIVFLLITLVTLITFYIIEINSVAVKNHKIKSFFV
jgi:hypothetical protein